MIKFSCFNVIIHEGNKNSIGYCLYNHSNKFINVYFLFESVLQTIDGFRRCKKEPVTLVFSRHGLTAKYKKYLLENVNNKGNATRTEQELIDLANAHCRLYSSRKHLLPINGIKQAIDYFRHSGFRVHALSFKDWLTSKG